MGIIENLDIRGRWGWRRVGRHLELEAAAGAVGEAAAELGAPDRAEDAEEQAARGGRAAGSPGRREM